MKPTRQQLEEARKVYHLFWNSYLNGDANTFATTLDDNFEMIGTSETELCHNKTEGIEFIRQQTEELIGSVDMRYREITSIPLGSMVLVNEFCDIYVHSESEWSFYSRFRSSAILRETPDGWKIAQQHGSLPDMRVLEGETLAIDKVSRENVELRDAIKRRTAELENKNRELEIEAAVERVRAEAMAMQSTNDFEKVTRQLLTQVKNLNLDGFTGASICMIDENQFISWWDFSSPGNVADPESQTVRYDAQTYKILGLDVLKKWQTGELYMELDYDLESLHAAVKEWESINADIANAFKEALLKGKLTHQWNPCGRISNGFLAFDMIRPPDDDVRKITIKMAHAFEQAHTRFLDLQKAEAMAREAKIETALEKVRSRSLAMHKSDELNEVVKVLFEKMTQLQVPSTAVAIQTFTEGSKDMQVFVCGDVGTGLVINQYLLPYFDHPIINDYLNTHKKNQDFFVGSYTKKEKDSFYDVVLKRPELKDLPAEVKTMIRKSEVYEVTMVPAEKSLLAVNDFQGNPLSESQINILKRFAKVFDQTYTRFLDLQRAEAQARESKIEAALEKVRSRSLAMHKSDELNEVVSVLFEKLKDLQIPFTAVGIATRIEGSKDLNAFVCGQNDAGLVITNYRLPYFDNPIPKDLFSALEKQLDFYVGHYSKEEKDSFYEYVLEHTAEFRHLPEDIKHMIFESPAYTITHVAVKNAVFNINDFEGKVLTEHEIDIIKRFAKVFDQAYTRFLDLQKAEAQAREAEIQLALERVRARAMAMQKSDELSDVIALISEQMSTLQIPVDDGVALITFDEESKDLNEWMANEGFETATNFHLPYFDHPVLSNLWEAKDQGQKELIQRYSAEESRSFLNYIFQHTDFSHTPEAVKEYCLAAETYATSIAFQKNTAIFINDYSGVSLSDSEMAILHRFAKEFDQTYTRFLDLQKAEAQAREAEVNLAVERVRAKALAMFKSEEILQVVIKLRNEILGLNIPNVTAATIHLKETNGMVRAWDLTSINNEEGQGLEISLDISYRLEDTHPDFFMREVWDRTEDYFVVIQGGDRYRHTVEWLQQNGHSDYAEEFEQFLESSQIEKAYHPTVQLNNGRMCIDMLEPPDPEVESILKKMAGAFDLAYKRFEDLQKAEAQTREVQIEAALERARAQSMMMQHSDEINTISNAFHEQLNLLGIPSEFSYVWLPDEANETHQFWASWSEVKAGENSLQSKQVTYPLDKSESYTAACFAAWATPDVVLEEFIPPKDIAGFFNVWKELLSGAKKLKPDYFPEGIYYSEAYMRYGCFGINIRRKLSEEEKNILKRFSKEFERAYTRFLDLQKAEEQALLIREERDRLEVALNKLEATQDQLIQQEKLASLGQLTAGIAHEIKNPLNFVNNFSEVSVELIEEAREEVRRATEDGGRKNSPLAPASRHLGEGSGEAERSRGVSDEAENEENPLLRGESKSRKPSGEARGVSGEADNSGRTQNANVNPGSANTPLNPLSRGEAGSSPQMELILEILDDIEANLRKIHEHGSRADGIVKSMLQHSRGGDGELEPTPLNPLIKEYVNLAFHGMRAGNEPINVDIDLQLDEGVGEVPLIAEDFSRVVLNIVNNAFDAMRDKQTGEGGPGTEKNSPLAPASRHLGEGSAEAERRRGVSGYAPKLSIRTKSSANAVTIEIEDNGPGIPDEIKDKIMQPFFTTKKGTQGTGLGLSITNDIVKAHGGTMNIDSQPEQTTFTIKFNR